MYRGLDILTNMNKFDDSSKIETHLYNKFSLFEQINSFEYTQLASTIVK